MFVGFIGAGIGNQLYDFSFSYILSQKYSQELVLAFDYSAERSPVYICLDELKIPTYKKIVFDQHRGSNWDYIQQLKEFYYDKTIYEVMEDDITLDARGELNLKNKELITLYDILVFTRHMYEPYYYYNWLPKLREMFQAIQSDTLEQLLPMIDERTVAIHIRQAQEVGNYDMDDYYRASVIYFEKKITNMKLFIFTNDIEYAREVLGCKKNYYYISLIPSGTKRDLEELLLLSACKFKILSNNSTYSTWSHLLNESSDKKVLLYDRNHSDIHIYLRAVRDIVYRNTERVTYLSQKKVARFSKLYKKNQATIYENKTTDKIRTLELKLEDCSDRESLISLLSEVNQWGIAQTYVLDKYEKNELLKIKTQISIRLENFIEAEACLRSVWNENIFDMDFHHLYYKILIKNKKMQDAFCEEEMLRILSGQKQPKSFVIIIEKYSRGSSLDRMVELGIILRKMGNRVTFIYSIDYAIPQYAKAVKTFLKQRVYFAKSLDQSTDTRIFMYCLEDILRQSSIENFVNSLRIPNNENILMTKVNCGLLDLSKVSGYTKMCMNSLTWYDREDYGTLAMAKADCAIRQLKEYDKIITSVEDILFEWKAEYNKKLIYFEELYKKEFVEVPANTRLTVNSMQRINPSNLLLAQICID